MTWDVVLDAAVGGIRGDLVPLSTTLKVNGVLTNATMALTVRNQSGTESYPAVSNPSTGVYTANYPVTQAGDHLYWWDATGAAVAVQQGQFSVEAVGLRLLSLDEAKRHLNITTTGDDEELREMIDTITAMVEHEVGPVIPRTYAETVIANGAVLLLSHVPVLSLTTVTAVQTGYTAPVLLDLTVEAEKGLVYYTAAGGLPYGRMRVTYRAGRQPTPAAIRGAAKIILANLWSTQRNTSGARAAVNMEESGVPLGWGYAIPNRARDLLAPYMRAPAVA